jgi:hypothetical protein
MKIISYLTVFAAFILGNLMFPSPVYCQIGEEQPWGVYENWNGSQIRADRWRGRSDLALEVKREIAKSQLVMRYRVAGSTSSNTGFINGYHRIYAMNASNINQIEADIKIKSSTITGCAENPGSTRIRPAAISLNKFNDGSSTGQEDMTGDHIVRVLVNRESVSSDPPGIFTTQAFLFSCTDSDCINGVSIAQALDMGKVRAGKWFTLRAIWDESNNRFLVRLNNGPDVILSYDSKLNSGPANTPFADVRMQMVAGNCVDGPTEMEAEIIVDQVRTNESAVIP